VGVTFSGELVSSIPLSLTNSWLDADARVSVRDLPDQLLSHFFKAVVRLRQIEPLAQNGMRPQAGAFINEGGMKFARRAYENAVPGFFLDGQDQDQPSKHVNRLAPEHRLLKKGRLRLQ
jgi:hypothetical protein